MRYQYTNEMRALPNKFHSYHWCPFVKLMLSFVKKLQNQPENIKKIILWSIIIVIGLGLLTIWILNFRQKIKEFKKEDLIKGFNLPNFQEDFKEIFPTGIPEFNKENFQEMEPKKETE